VTAKVLFWAKKKKQKLKNGKSFWAWWRKQFWCERETFQNQTEKEKKKGQSFLTVIFVFPGVFLEEKNEANFFLSRFPLELYAGKEVVAGRF
jgi:hypothetical protein